VVKCRRPTRQWQSFSSARSTYLPQSNETLQLTQADLSSTVTIDSAAPCTFTNADVLALSGDTVYANSRWRIRVMVKVTGGLTNTVNWAPSNRGAIDIGTARCEHLAQRRSGGANVVIAAFRNTGTIDVQHPPVEQPPRKPRCHPDSRDEVSAHERQFAREFAGAVISGVICFRNSGPI
jgi:hypothetical protein